MPPNNTFAISSTIPLPSASVDLARQVRHLISRRKHVRVRQLRPTARLMHELNFDLLDLVDIILEVERFFHLTIPDEIPLNTVGDLVRYVGAHSPAAHQA